MKVTRPLKWLGVASSPRILVNYLLPPQSVKCGTDVPRDVYQRVILGRILDARLSIVVGDVFLQIILRLWAKVQQKEHDF